MAVEWIALGAGGAAAIVFGVRRHRPARIGPWMLLAGAILALAAGDVFYAYDEQAVASLFYYGLFLLVAAGRNWSAGLLLVGAVGLLASNIAYPLSPGWVTEVGFIVLYVSWAAAAVHPSMVRL